MLDLVAIHTMFYIVHGSIDHVQHCDSHCWLKKTDLKMFLKILKISNLNLKFSKNNSNGLEQVD